MIGFVSPRDLVRRGAERHGARLAVTSLAENLTYSELADRTARVAQILKRSGVGPGIQVALSMPNSPEFVVWYFGVLEAGAIVVPLASTQTPPESAAIMETAGISFLVTGETAALPRDIGFNPAAAPGAARGTVLWRMDRDPARLETTPWTPEGFLLRRFSSGSTGRPKHMLRAEFAMIDNARQVTQTIGLSEGERFLAVAAFGHGYGLGCLQMAFFLGGSVSVLPRFLPSATLELARRDKPTVFMMTPPLVEALATCLLEDGDERAFDSLKHCECSTGRLAKATHDAFLERYGISVRPRYGVTEISTVAIDMEDDFDEHRVGRPFPGITIAILDEDGNPRPIGATGYVALRSERATDHYVDEPEISALTFRDGYVFPGDMGYLDDQGRLHVLGRSDVINIGGAKVDRLEVERVIRDALPVRDVAVMEGERAGLPVIRAMIEGDPAVITRQAVIAACRAKLSAYKIPALVEILEKFDRDANGKVLKSFFKDQASQPEAPGEQNN